MPNPQDYHTVNPYDGQPLPPDQRAYKAKNGKIQVKPSTQLVVDLDDAGLGFCLNCGHDDQNAEPDARKYTCEVCGEAKVYGGAELILMGLTF